MCVYLSGNHGMLIDKEKKRLRERERELMMGEQSEIGDVRRIGVGRGTMHFHDLATLKLRGFKYNNTLSTHNSLE